MFIRNTDLFGYDSPKIALNDGRFKLEYPMSIPSGEEINLNLSVFARSDGERFDIIKFSLIDISISCECSKWEKGQWKGLGKSFYHGTFK